jgi:tRNA dimethylallyltransferase
MLSNGLVDEVKSLIEKGYEKNLVSMRGIGYKEVIDYLEGTTDYEDMVNILKKNTRRFAKRQYTWFLRDKNVKWFAMDNLEKTGDTINNILEYVKMQI